ncbi:STAS domain-containing protein [Paludibacterium paludis]|uniref:STAS domain-containing protein n=1 Tax=Paludibacterium paludis TaxID=1225769 RepID=UPI00167991F5|nr:STAS domain-containing protein [Paludibacterium paludis]
MDDIARSRAPASLTLATVGDFLDQCRDRWGKGQALIVELGDVGEIDTAGAQLLAWLQREGRLTGRAVTLDSPPARVIETMAMLGLGKGVSDGS